MCGFVPVVATDAACIAVDRILALVIDDEAELRQGAFRLPVSSETSYHSHENKSRAERRGKCK
jgi:hypothetical protein